MQQTFTLNDIKIVLSEVLDKGELSTIEELFKNYVKDTKIEEVVAKPQDEYQFPELWEVKLTDEIIESVNIYRRALCINHHLNRIRYKYLKSDGFGYRLREGTPYIEITSEQFMMHVVRRYPEVKVLPIPF